MTGLASMYVCICQSISDRQIRDAVRRGARSLDEVQQDLDIATGCGTCRECAEQIVNEAIAALRAPVLLSQPTLAF